MRCQISAYPSSAENESSCFLLFLYDCTIIYLIIVPTAPGGDWPIGVRTHKSPSRRWQPHPIAPQMDVGETTTSKRATSPSTLISSRPKRPKTSKACNACRKQKSRCERLAGDSEGCHRCSVIGIPCVFDTEPISTDITKTRRPRPILPKNSKVSPIIEPSGAPVLTSTVNGRHQQVLHIISS